VADAGVNQTRRLRLRTGGLAGAALGMFVLGVTASEGAAWTANLDGTTLRIVAAAGERDSFSVAEFDAGSIVVSDQVNVPSGAPAGCTVTADNALVCPRSAVTAVSVEAETARTASRLTWKA
jgi:hypothetical protein